MAASGELSPSSGHSTFGTLGIFIDQMAPLLLANRGRTQSALPPRLEALRAGAFGEVVPVLYPSLLVGMTRPALMRSDGSAKSCAGVTVARATATGIGMGMGMA